jgi:hypothetical protein
MSMYQKVDFTNPMDFTSMSSNLPAVEDTEYRVHNNYIKISSADRDRSVYPGTAKFRVRLPYEYKDVYSLSLSAGILPNLDNISTDAFTYLKIQELDHIKLSDGDDVFGVMILHTANTTNFYNIDKSSTNMMPRRFIEPKQRLSEISIELLHPDKTPVNFGTEGSTGLVNQAIQTSFTFEIKTIRKLKKFHNDTKNVYLG